MTRRRDFERRLEELEERREREDDELRGVADQDVPDEQVDAVIAASRKHLANEDLDPSEARLVRQMQPPEREAS